MQVFALNRIPDSAIPFCGGKARGLCQLTRAGFNVPRGFVLYQMATAQDIEEAVHFYLSSGLQSVAVRSSASNEDGENYSNAGQYETCLNVKGEVAFRSAVKKCFDSLNDERAEKYAQSFLNDATSSMNIVVQEMVTAEKAGVCFTQSPNDNSQLLIEAVKGLGEGLVSGEKKAESYLFSSPDSFTKDGILNKKDSLQIFYDAKKAEEVFKKPLDLEWAIDGKDTLYWLQARPITVHGAVPLDELDSKSPTEGHVFTTCNIREMMPGAVTPLTLSTSMESIDWGMRKMLTRCHAYSTMSDIPQGSCIRNYSNHMFIDLTMLLPMERCVLGASSEAMQLSLCGKVYPEIKPSSRPDEPKIQKFFNGISYVRWMMGYRKAKRRISHLSERLNFDLSESSSDLYRELVGKQSQMDKALYYHYVTSSYSGAMYSAAFMSLTPDYQDEALLKTRLAAALEGIKNIESVNIFSSMRQVALTMLKEDPALKDASVKTIEDRLSTITGASKKAYDTFMSRHGHRCIREAEIRSKPWKRNTSAFASNLQMIMSSPNSLAEPKIDVNKNINALLATEKGIKRYLFKKLIINARKGVYYREFSKAKAVLVIDKFKEGYSALGQKLAAERRLPDADLIYFLTKEEIGDLIDGENSLIKKAMARRRLLPAQGLVSFSEMNFGKPVSKKKSPARGQKVLTGSSISNGYAIGKARIVRTIEDANNLQSGEIMVAAFTDIGWSPYYCKIAGLIAEIGSALSHGAVVAREYALPLIANVSDATSIIQTGDWLVLDASKGEVTILSEEEKNRLLNEKLAYEAATVS